MDLYGLFDIPDIHKFKVMLSVAESNQPIKENMSTYVQCNIYLYIIKILMQNVAIYSKLV